jgi:hypothetical protein
MQSLFIAMWNKLTEFSNNNDFKSYGALLNSIIELIKQLLKRELITLEVSDNYNIIVYGIETHLTLRDINL